jgi:CRISPR-associated protein Cas2
MVILILENVPTSLRGELTRWLIEPRPGVFLGNVSAMVRDKLWDVVMSKAPEGGGMLLHTARTEQGYAVRTFGDTTRTLVDVEGLTLVRRREQKRPPPARKTKV